MEIDITKMENGDLRIAMPAVDDRQELAELLDANDRNFWTIISDLFETYSCNGSYQPFDAGDANPFVGLTDAPCIAEAMDVDDDGKQSIQGDFWFYGSYMILDPLEVLSGEGEVIFTLAR